MDSITFWLILGPITYYLPLFLNRKPLRVGDLVLKITNMENRSSFSAAFDALKALSTNSDAFELFAREALRRAMLHDQDFEKLHKFLDESDHYGANIVEHEARDAWDTAWEIYVANMNPVEVFVQRRFVRPGSNAQYKLWQAFLDHDVEPTGGFLSLVDEAKMVTNWIHRRVLTRAAELMQDPGDVWNLIDTYGEAQGVDEIWKHLVVIEDRHDKLAKIMSIRYPRSQSGNEAFEKIRSAGTAVKV